MAHDPKTDADNKELVGQYNEPAKEDAAAVDPKADNDKAEDATKETEAVEPVEQPAATPEATPEAATLKTGPDYLARFGDVNGGKWFAQGKNWEECLELHEQALLTKIESLESKLTTSQEGEESPVDFSSTDEQDKRTGFASKIRIAGKAYK